MFNKRSAVPLVLSFALAACASGPKGPSEAQTLTAAKANTQLGIEYLRTGEMDLSRKRLEKAIKLAPDYAGAHDAIAVLYEQVGERELAEKHYRKSIRLEPDNAGSQNNYGQFLCKAKRYEEAEEIFKRAASNPFYRKPWVPLTNAGICLLGVPDEKRAEEYFRQALQSQPEYAPALMSMGSINYARGNYLSARAYLQRYEAVAEHTAESLWLAIRTEYSLRDHQAWGNYALMLRNSFPDSEQYMLLQEWENERRSGN